VIAGSKTPGLTELADNRGLASYPIVLDQDAWWKEWGPKIEMQEGRQGWILFVLDAQAKILEVSMKISQNVRNRWAEAGGVDVEQASEAALRWFEENYPKAESLPEWARFIVSAQYGNFCVLARLGRELKGVQDHGFNTLVLENDGQTLKEVA
jgi:hypothetical protein